MRIHFDNNYFVDIGQTHGLGSPWIVKTYRKAFLFRRLISTDWFLDGDQAKRYADAVAAQAMRDPLLRVLKTRKPGWTLFASSR